jgi:hypothetical protein
MKRIYELLTGGDLRSLGQSKKLINLIQNQKDFDSLFKYLLNPERLTAMRAADVIEKITVEGCSYLRKHKKALLKLCKTATHKELKWHLALLVVRLELKSDELAIIFKQLTLWVLDKQESRIVRVNSLQALYDLSSKYQKVQLEFEGIISELKKQNIPSLNSRIRILEEQTPKCY